MRYFVVLVAFLVVGLGAFGTWLRRDEYADSLLGLQGDGYLPR
jgi:hypothetical protein